MNFATKAFEIVAQIKNCPEGATTETGCNTTLPQIDATSGTLEKVLPIVFATITALAVLIIVIQGIRFVLSQGEPDKSAQARKGVIYAAVGLIIVFTADVFVAFFLKRII